MISAQINKISNHIINTNPSLYTDSSNNHLIQEEIVAIKIMGYSAIEGTFRFDTAAKCNYNNQHDAIDESSLYKPTDKNGMYWGNKHTMVEALKEIKSRNYMNDQLDKFIPFDSNNIDGKMWGNNHTIVEVMKACESQNPSPEEDVEADDFDRNGIYFILQVLKNNIISADDLRRTLTQKESFLKRW